MNSASAFRKSGAKRKLEREVGVSTHERFPDAAQPSCSQFAGSRYLQQPGRRRDRECERQQSSGQLRSRRRQRSHADGRVLQVGRASFRLRFVRAASWKVALPSSQVGSAALRLDAVSPYRHRSRRERVCWSADLRRVSQIFGASENGRCDDSPVHSSARICVIVDDRKTRLYSCAAGSEARTSSIASAKSSTPDIGTMITFR